MFATLGARAATGGTMAASEQALAARGIGSPGGLLKAAAWTLICLLVVAFIGKYVFHYYLNYDPRGFDVFWPKRGALLAHMSTGMVALVIGPLQFWSGLKAKLPGLHRWLGRTYLVAVAAGSAAGLYLALTTSGGWAYGSGLAMLALAWASCGAVAYVAIRRGAVVLHRRWMVRSYVVTFAFVIYRLVADVLPTAQLKPASDLAIADAWGCWAVPLLATVLVQAVGDIRRQGRRPRTV